MTTTYVLKSKLWLAENPHHADYRTSAEPYNPSHSERLYRIYRVWGYGVLKGFRVFRGASAHPPPPPLPQHVQDAENAT